MKWAIFIDPRIETEPSGLVSTDKRDFEDWADDMLSRICSAHCLDADAVRRPFISPVRSTGMTVQVAL